MRSQKGPGQSISLGTIVRRLAILQDVEGFECQCKISWFSLSNGAGAVSKATKSTKNWKIPQKSLQYLKKKSRVSGSKLTKQLYKTWNSFVRCCYVKIRRNMDNVSYKATEIWLHISHCNWGMWYVNYKTPYVKAIKFTGPHKTFCITPTRHAVTEGSVSGNAMGRAKTLPRITF